MSLFSVTDFYESLKFVHNYVTAVVYYVFLHHFAWEIGAQPAKIDPFTHAL